MRPATIVQQSRQAPEPAISKPILEPSGRLIDEVSSSSERATAKPTAAELRQARAQLRQQQRLERMERNLWYGYEPLRPTWNAVPYTHSRYGYRTTYIVPIYYGR